MLIAAHQGFCTRKACQAIAETTIRNVSDFEHGTILDANRVTTRLMVPRGPDHADGRV